MQYNGLAWAVALVALLVLTLGGRILFRRGWFLGWLRGTCGLGLLLLAVLAAVMAWDLRSYAALPPAGDALLSLSVNAQGTQRYRVTLQEREAQRNVIVNGELWQLDARVFGWKGLATLIGLRPGYRLESLSARYRDIEREAGMDLFLVDARGARVAFLPLVDGAVYRVRLTSEGLLAEPQNEPARAALVRN
jgi:hypothetical protein